VVETDHLHQGRGKATVSLSLKNLLTGQLLNKTFKSDENLEVIETEELQLHYHHRDRNNFYFEDDDKKQYSLDQKVVGERAEFLKTDLPIKGIFIEGRLVQIKLPVKAAYRVVEAPPDFKGNTVQGGSKIVKLETGAQIKTPFFVNVGDVVVVNIEKQEYVGRMR